MRLNPVLAQQRCDLLNEGVPQDSLEVQRLNAQLVEHDAACALLASEAQARVDAKRTAQDGR